MKYLFDTNAVIYYLEDKFTFDIQDEDVVDISFVSEIELLGKEISKEESEAIYLFLEQVHIINIDEEIKKKTIELRKSKKLKIPDAIIVATALVNNAILLTADKEILKKVEPDFVRNPLDDNQT